LTPATTVDNSIVGTETTSDARRDRGTLSRFLPARALLISLTERDSPGIWGGMLRRKRYVDDKVVDALNAGITAVVNRGAGWDTQAYRLPSRRTIRVFEGDLPETIEAKRRKLQQVFGHIPENVTLVPLDFDHQDLAEVLRSYGYHLGEKTIFSWEGVTQYLTESGVRRTFTYLGKAAVGSRLVFTYVQKDFLDGTSQFGVSTHSQVVRLKEQL
jgi:methyltransferase (TIGR00027 family)